MGLWSFAKSAGKKIFSSGKAEAATPEADALKQELADLGLDSSGVEIKVEGDKVVVEGNAVSAEMKEKIILAVGNIDGVAEVEAEVSEGPEPVFHTVVKGDNLSAIAKKTLGNANRYNEIFEANRPMLSHPDKIYPGQVLRIPQ
ncbi:BON domain-containing protein [Roseinatronobacter thiooxidans]|uniref:Potassium binding protein Kbp n=1 Tax=Roseinatronobacter thiooxidans TaxID=121821 RepID=A0A2W7QHX5_9RHOB|nr:peptidoglycan-binding protein LysM [Roseinatronobacter thiooxidans]PZX47873.1 BON domain-containing protein [Roseinatronobacter thiooxidans]